MRDQTRIWSTDGQGVLIADVDGFTVSVERLYPAADVRFVVWGDGYPHAPIASGVRASSDQAKLAAEQVAEAIAARTRLAGELAQAASPVLKIVDGVNDAGSCHGW